MVNRPHVKNYLQITHYLRDVYLYLKESRPHFSYEIWAEELKITSRSHLRLAVIGRRNISEALASSLVINLDLKNEDKDYFLLLIQYSQSTTPDQKTYYSRKLAEMVNVSTEKQIVSPSLDLLKDPSIIALRLLLTFPDVNRSEKDLSQMLNIPIDDLKVKLDILKSHDLVGIENGQWSAKTKWIQFATNHHNEALKEYYVSSLDKAQKAIDYPAEQRYFRSLMWAMNRSEYQEFIGDFNEFMDKMSVKYSKDTLDDREILQMNMNLIPTLSIPKS